MDFHTLRQEIRTLVTRGVIDEKFLDHFEHLSTKLPKVGDIFLDFELIKELGRGSFGVVFLARQTSLAGRLVAIKISADLFCESQTLAQLQHTNIMPVYSSGVSGTLQAVVMPYYGSTTLATIYREIRDRKILPQSADYLVSTLKSRRMDLSTLDRVSPKTVIDRKVNTRVELPELPQEEGPTSVPDSVIKLLERFSKLTYVEAVLWIGQGIAAGLAHAHERGIIHRDLKPANILLTDDGTPMILDFNLAQDVKDELRQIFQGGTLPYMSPEQLKSVAGQAIKLDGRSDLYSLGLILHQLLTGKCIYSQETISGSLTEAVPLMLESRLVNPVFAMTTNTGVTPAVRSIVLKCIQPDPQSRYQSASELVEDIERHLKNLPLRYAEDPSRLERLQKWTRRNPKLCSPLVLVALAASLLLCVIVAFAKNSYDNRQRELTDNIAIGQEKIRSFNDQNQLTRQYLTAPFAQPSWIQEGLKHGFEALKTLGADRDVNWLNQPAFSHLDETERGRLKANAEELSYFISLTELTHPALGKPLENTFKNDHQRLRELPLLAEKKSFLSAVELQMSGRYRESLKILEGLEREYPNVPEYRFLLGRALHMTGDYLRAHQEYSVCIALNPNFSAGYYNRAYISNKLGIPQALIDIEKAALLEPDNADIRLLQAQILGRHQHYLEALKAIDIVCNQPSPPIWSWFTRATLNELKGDKEAAARDLENGFAGHAVEYQDFISRGLARMQTDPQAALLDFQAAEKMDPQPVEALQNQAHVEARYLNHTENAIDILQRLLKRNPDFLEARDALAVYYARLGQAEKALKIVSQMKAGEPSANAQYQTACVYALLAKKDLRYVPEALKQLASSLQRGFGFDYLMIDKDLDPVRNHPDFKVLSDFVQKTEQLKIAQP